ncbi:Panacea domain-containing protein [Solwaraspora sp. WMMB762]|uniref:Panacea domain-containing protein n=1 Tax=Solwaraspora sp. WMMB762 TaxID=3404120 RepID=UPI003B9284FE
MKLQKLCYYAQAWHLVWEDRPLFDNEIQAWANGPVVPDLYLHHRGRLQVAPGELPGHADALTAGERESIDVVLEFYGELTAHQLSELTHREAPWRDARSNAGLAPMERGTARITHAAMFEYYDGLTSTDD